MTDSDNNLQFTPEERRLIELVIITPTISKTKLAELMDLSRPTIINIYNRPHVQNEIKKYQQSNIERFVELQSEALECLSELMSSHDESIKLQASKTFADALKTLKIEHAGEVGVRGQIQIIVGKPRLKNDPESDSSRTD